jgi:hypothetical protein
MDRNYWLNALNTLNASQNADNSLALQRAQNAAQIAAQGSAAINASNAMLNNERFNEWKDKSDMINSISGALSDTSTGLAFLYGYNKNKSKA